jgi:hypothetical protein
MIDEQVAKAQAEKDAIERDRKIALEEEAAKTQAPLSEVQLYARKEMKDYGWGAKEYACLETLWTKESNWRSNAVSKTNDHGIPQRNMPDATKAQKREFLADPKAQIAWGLGYIDHRYGSPCQALSFHNSRNWY